ncbi:MAG: hypothetical protein ACOY4I_00445 [Bacillota bacterium]
MREKIPHNQEGHADSDRHRVMLFATERAEDYVVLSLALVILIIILVFY